MYATQDDSMTVTRRYITLAAGPGKGELIASANDTVIEVKRC
jgi:hypothetical protein